VDVFELLHHVYFCPQRFNEFVNVMHVGREDIGSHKNVLQRFGGEGEGGVWLGLESSRVVPVFGAADAAEVVAALVESSSQDSCFARWMYSFSAILD